MLLCMPKAVCMRPLRAKQAHAGKAAIECSCQFASLLTVQMYEVEVEELCIMKETSVVQCEIDCIARRSAYLVKEVGALKAFSPALKLTNWLADVYRHTEMVYVLANKVLDEGPDVQLLGRFSRFRQALPSRRWPAQICAQPFGVPP